MRLLRRNRRAAGGRAVLVPAATFTGVAAIGPPAETPTAIATITVQRTLGTL